MLPLLNYQSYKITFTIMISLLSIPFPEWFFCSNSKIRNKKNRKKKLQNFQKKSMSWSGIRSGPVRSTGSGVPIRSGPVRFRKSRSGRLLVGIILCYLLSNFYLILSNNNPKSMKYINTLFYLFIKICRNEWNGWICLCNCILIIKGARLRGSI